MREGLATLHHRLLATDVEALAMSPYCGLVEVCMLKFSRNRCSRVRVVRGSSKPARTPRALCGSTAWRSRRQLRARSGGTGVAREAIPGFVDDHLDAALVRRLDDGRQVVAQPIVGAGSEDERLRVGVLGIASKSAFFGTGPYRPIFLVERRVEVNRVRAGEHHAVVHALVAVAVEEQLLPGREQGLKK